MQCLLLFFYQYYLIPFCGGSKVFEWNFEAITDETAFYVNEEGNVVISFNEGDVAPVYMGVVTFTIPDETLQGIKKETQ